MRLDKYHSIAIKVAARDADGDYMLPMYDTVDDLLDAHRDAVSNNPSRSDEPFPKANFLFQIIDSRTGKTPPNVAEGYENINDAYTAFQLHVAPTPEDAAIKRLYAEMRKWNVQVSHFQVGASHHVSVCFAHKGQLQTWSGESSDIDFLVNGAIAYVDATLSGKPLTITL